MENGYKQSRGSAVTITPVGFGSKNFTTKKKSRKLVPILFMVIVPLLICFILVMIFFFAAKIPPPKPYTSPCLGSEEANRTNLTNVLKKIHRQYFFELHPEKIYQMARVKPEDIRMYFRPYDPTPNATKNRTDVAMELRRELNALKFNKTLLKLRERKAVHVANTILENNFGWSPYFQDYYNGDWLLGPDIFCWHPVCDVFYHLNRVFDHFKPRNMTELEKLKDLFEGYNRTFNRYVENWKLGARTGYVKTNEACKAGLFVIKYQKYRAYALKNEAAIYDEPFAKILLNTSYFEHLSKRVNDSWKEVFLMNVTEYFRWSLVHNIAKAVVHMLRFLEHEYLRNCPSDENIISGLGKVPLRFLYYDDIPDTSQLAFHRLPTGEELSGPKTYQTLMKYFATLDISPADLRERAWTRLNELYKQAVDVAKRYTGEKDNRTAITAFKAVLRHSNMSFNNKPFPANESDENAYIKCYDDKSAQGYCPERWKAMQKWIENTVETMKNNIGPVYKPLFYRSGPKNTVPVCPVDVISWFHPHVRFHGYVPGSKDCKVKATQGLPFFADNFGPKWTEFTTTAHEQLPGHHLEVHSYIEYFEDSCNDPIHWLEKANYFPGFTEGWTTYVEYQLLPQDTNLYSDNQDKEILLQRYGMIYYQLLAALRAIVDIDLNFNQTPEITVLDMYNEYVWEDNTDLAKKDVLRSQSVPGFVTSYMIGQMEISRVRSIAERELGRNFNLEEFHYELLRQGEFPLRYLEEHIRDYITCKKDPTIEGCKEF